MDQLRSHGVDKELVLTGFTKLDPLFSQNPIFDEKLAQSLGLDPSKKRFSLHPLFIPVL
jgi:hypothetical protein